MNRNGGVSREIRVILDPVKLQAYGLTASQVNQALRQVNLDAAGGRAEIAGSEQSVRVLGNARNAYELGQTQINVGGGRTVRLANTGSGTRVTPKRSCTRAIMRLHAVTSACRTAVLASTSMMTAWSRSMR